MAADRYLCIETNQYDGKKVYVKGGLYPLPGSPPAAFFEATDLDIERPRNIVGYTDMDDTYYFGKGIAGWDDMRFPSTGINPPGQVSDPDRDANDGTFLFDKASTEIIMGIAQMPHSWEVGTVIYPHVHWGPIDTGGGDVVWKFDYDIANTNEAFAGSWSTNSIIAAAGIVTNMHLPDGFAPLDMSSYDFSCIIKWRLSRVGGNGSDTYDDDAKLYELDFHYKLDSLGSGRQFLK